MYKKYTYSLDESRKVCYTITIGKNSTLSKDSPKRLHLEITFIVILNIPL